MFTSKVLPSLSDLTCLFACARGCKLYSLCSGAVSPCNLPPCVSCQVWSQLCDRPCLCPTSAPQCPSGVPLVPDGCRCCPVCARQLGEPCSDRFPCDARRGLRCDDSASFPGGAGECVGEFHDCVGRTDARCARGRQHVFEVCSAGRDSLLGGRSSLRSIPGASVDTSCLAVIDHRGVSQD